MCFFLSSPCWRAAFRSNSVVWRLIQSLRFTGFRRGEIFSQHLFSCKETLFASVSDHPADRQPGAQKITQTMNYFLGNQLPYTKNCLANDFRAHGIDRSELLAQGAQPEDRGLSVARGRLGASTRPDDSWFLRCVQSVCQHLYDSIMPHFHPWFADN